MTLVTVYQFTIYNVQSDERCLSRRWGTKAGIAAVCGTPIESTATDVDASFVGQEEFDLTVRDFNPKGRPPGFQTRVSI
jgi:hypothetical protein